eukprot:TRINITY_DN57327_c0_g1_i1.p1 TRINITY_DN57327_c0_g1~~TRINITY_DN57327_c0_g1_i1.p1  ORF type:complete len:413 (+),score=57.69 TRINITY_DN57327_c0_g1_i1:46-1239(+)
MPPKVKAKAKPKAQAKADVKIVNLSAEEQFEAYSDVLDVFKETIGINNKLSFDELLGLFQELDPDWTEQRMRQAWGALDKDKSGDVDYLELLHFAFDMDKWQQASLADYTGLMRTPVYCRVRPIGKDGHGMGEEVEKKLDGWTEESVFVKDRHERAEYTFPTRVLTPEKSQDEVYKTVMHDVCDAWIANATNVVLLAYGQTGTGKTHTMFGPKESLTSDELHGDWGLFPRAAHKALTTISAFVKGYEGSAFKFKVTLHASAIEFYMGTANDLLAGKGVPLLMLPDGTPVGLSSVEITKVSDLAPFLEQVYSNRTTSGTKMNSGSSRSHCALQLTLAECCREEGEGFFYFRRSLTLMDMAGSERPDKAGTQRMTTNDGHTNRNHESNGVEQHEEDVQE